MILGKSFNAPKHESPQRSMRSAEAQENQSQLETVPIAKDGEIWGQKDQEASKMAQQVKALVNSSNPGTYLEEADNLLNKVVLWPSHMCPSTLAHSSLPHTHIQSNSDF